ncbi:MAG: ATP synthase F1 subunit gamma [Candidatus Obscuribacterales bacterium]|nr:ATP synthase F1 subunit gamma [Candidatus Obscuribacterales bacterium]
MANLKAIRQRIRSVQNTQKITRAMRLVAAAKVRRAQMRTLAARPFTSHVIKLLQQVVEEVASIDLQGLPLLEIRPVRKVALIIITSDRGLCGSYNTNILKNAALRIRELQSEGKDVSLITIGLKAAGFFKRISIEKSKTYTLLPAVPTVEEAKLIAEHACELYSERKVDAVEIIGTNFVNMIKQDVTSTVFLPVTLPEGVDHYPLSSETLFEPTLIELMEEELLPKYVENVLYQALLEASASELAARMNAMTSATNNAKELIQNLTLVYNKARQASITQELLEIVAGAEALEK